VRNESNNDADAGCRILRDWPFRSASSDTTAMFKIHHLDTTVTTTKQTKMSSRCRRRNRALAMVISRLPLSGRPQLIHPPVKEGKESPKFANPKRESRKNEPNAAHRVAARRGNRREFWGAELGVIRE